MDQAVHRKGLDTHDPSRECNRRRAHPIQPPTDRNHTETVSGVAWTCRPLGGGERRQATDGLRWTDDGGARGVLCLYRDEPLANSPCPLQGPIRRHAPRAAWSRQARCSQALDRTTRCLTGSAEAQEEHTTTGHSAADGHRDPVTNERRYYFSRAGQAARSSSERGHARGTAQLVTPADRVGMRQRSPKLSRAIRQPT